MVWASSTTLLYWMIFCATKCLKAGKFFYFHYKRKSSISINDILEDYCNTLWNIMCTTSTLNHIMVGCTVMIQINISYRFNSGPLQSIVSPLLRVMKSDCKTNDSISMKTVFWMGIYLGSGLAVQRPGHVVSGSLTSVYFRYKLWYL